MLQTIEVDFTSNLLGEYFSGQYETLRYNLEQYMKNENMGDICPSNVVSCRNGALEFVPKLQLEQIAKDIVKPLIILGEGYYHHLTYASFYSLNEEVVYVHIDHHHDQHEIWSDFVDCGNFVSLIKEHPKCRGVVHLSRAGGGVNFEGKDIYLSIDLDVLSKREFCTAYNQGSMTIKQLLDLVGFIKNNCNIKRADICGYFGGPITVYPELVKLLIENPTA